MKNSILLFMALVLAAGNLYAAADTYVPPAEPKPGSSKYGADDQRGAANLITAQKVLQAASLIKKGKIYDIEATGLVLPYGTKTGWE